MKKIIALPVILAAALSWSEQRVFAQMTVVTSPALQIPPGFYNIPNPLGYQQAGAAAVAPLQQAIEANNAARNQFLLNQMNNDFALRQQQLQIQAAAEAQNREILSGQEANRSAGWGWPERRVQPREADKAAATKLVRQTADRIQVRIDQGVAAIENP